jgi:hypothetical protein
VQSICDEGLGGDNPVIAGGTKVSMSIAAARKELKGERKNLPEVPSLEDHTHPTSNFVSNAGNRAHHNGA